MVFAFANLVYCTWQPLLAEGTISTVRSSDSCLQVVRSEGLGETVVDGELWHAVAKTQRREVKKASYTFVFHVE